MEDNIPQNEESQLEDIFGNQVKENTEEKSDLAKSIMEKVDSGYKPEEKQKIETNQSSMEIAGDTTLMNLHNNFFSKQQEQGIADIQYNPNSKEKSLPPDVYKNSADAYKIDSDATKVATEINQSTVKKEEKSNKEINIKPGEGNDFQIRSPEEERIIIREDETSIKQYEKDVEEKEKQEFEKQMKEQEELIKNLEKDLSSEMTDEIIENNSESDTFRIRSYLDGKEITDDKKDSLNKKEEDKEFIGGDKNSSLFTHLASEWGKRMAANPASKIPEKIVGRDYILSNTELDIADFIKQKNRFTLNTQTKTVLPFSGMTVYVNSYTGSTLINLLNAYTKWRAQYEWARQNNVDESFNQMVSESYYKLRELELKSIYSHISSIKLAGEREAIAKPSEEDFFRMVKYPDLNTLYFAVFHSTNKTKRKKYSITCNQNVLDEKTKLTIQCDGVTDVSLYDEELVFTIENPYITKEDFYQMIRDEYPNGKILGTTRISRTEIERLSETKTNFTQHVPSLWDYLETLRIMNAKILDDDGHIFSYDISLIDEYIPPEDWNKQQWDRAKLLKSYLYIKKIDFLYPVGEKEFEYRTLSIENNQRELIFDILNSLSIDDTYLLTKGKEIKELMTLKVLDYYVPSIKCSKCGTQLRPVKFDVRFNFFTRISEARSAQNQA